MEAMLPDPHPKLRTDNHVTSTQEANTRADFSVAIKQTYHKTVAFLMT